MKQIAYIILVAFCLTSCNNWLDVRPDTEQKDNDQFSTTSGFFDALVGCYMSLASSSLYGEKLTISNIESLANLWYVSSSSSRYEDADLAKHDYTTDNCKNVVNSVYGGLYRAIVQANMIIKYADEQSEAFTNDTLRYLVQGEAYAIRALCQFDALRLFGQLPQNATQQVMLPYSYTTSIKEMPAYYDFDEYVTLLKDDLDKAEKLLAISDPILDYTFEELEGKVNLADNHLYYRQSRLNYWAVKALQARMHLYLGETEDAYQLAKEIIDAKGPDGAPVIELSGASDLDVGYNALPHECLFYVSQTGLYTAAVSLLIGGEQGIAFTDSHLGITTDMHDELYQDIPSNWGYNRKELLWGQTQSSGRTLYRTLKKYWWDDSQSDGGTADQLTHSLIPVLRLSEMYLIAMECAPSLAEANALYTTYMEDHGISPTILNSLANMDEVQEFVINEYRREFFGEGLMFYTYKRLNAKEILWYDGNVTESTYILPLPETEYNPNNL